MAKVSTGKDRRRSIAAALLLRFGVCWIALLFAFEQHGAPLRILPVAGSPLHHALEQPMDLLAQAVGIHFFHLNGRAAQLHAPATGDTALGWVAALVMLVLAILAGTVWFLVARERTQDERLLRWFRLGVSLLLGVSLVEYGFLKVFPLQFPSPPLALLNEPVGNASPTLLFWSVYGLNPILEMTMGWIEVVTGVLLLFRRTAFAGALLALAVTANVAMLDLAFGVPVKLFSLTLVVLAVALLATEAKTMFAFLLRWPEPVHRSAWAPEFRSVRGRRIAIVAEVAFAALACWHWASGTWSVYRMKLEALRDPAAFTGEWAIQGQSWMRSGNDTPITTIFFDPNTDMMLRDAQGNMWRSRAIYNRANRTLRILYEAGGMTMFRVDQLREDLLELVPIGPRSQHLSPVTMTRIPLPQSYPLLQRQFHWVNDFEPLR